jgi:[acyl-carrier-protein] S-malonyltransferase
MAKTALVFPGQGSQYVGMAQAFCDASPRADELMLLAEQKSGLPLKKLCFEGPMDELTQTVNLQPALVAVDLICLEALKSAGINPFAVAGHSLGEYPALAACGAISAEDCLSLVSLRGRLMDREAGKYPGAMSALMGLSPEEVAALTGEIGGVVQPANYNTPVQTVITGAKEAVARAGALAKERGAKAIPLKVSGAWHSPFMAEAQKEMETAIEDSAFTEPSCLHVPNTTGVPTADAGLIKAELKKQLTSPVRWVQTINALVEAGVDTFIECGPKNVLSGLIKKTAPKEIRVLRFDTPEELEKVKSELS